MTVVNFNKAKKARARVKARARADENAARFGRTKSEKQAEATRLAAEKARLEGHKLDKDRED